MYVIHHEKLLQNTSRYVALAVLSFSYVLFLWSQDHNIRLTISASLLRSRTKLISFSSLSHTCPGMGFSFFLYFFHG